MAVEKEGVIVFQWNVWIIDFFRWRLGVWRMNGESVKRRVSVSLVSLVGEVDGDTITRESYCHFNQA